MGCRGDEWGRAAWMAERFRWHDGRTFAQSACGQHDTRNEEPIATEDFRRLVQAHVDGVATDGDIAVLSQREDDWIEALEDMLDDIEERLDRVRRSVHGPERDLVIPDLEADYWRIDGLLVEITGEEAVTVAEPAPPEPAREPEPEPVPPAPPGLQLTW